MATTMISFLPQAPHELWQTAASPYIIPSTWQSMYEKCPRCGGNAPNICDAIWPENWWEDDMMGLMYQGHIPPSQRTSPWEQYYLASRVPYLPPMTPQTPLRVQTVPYQYQSQAIGTKGPMTPPMTPGVPRRTPSYVAPQPTTPSSPTLPYSKQGTWSSMDSGSSSFDDGKVAHIPDLRIISLLGYSNF